MDIHTINSFLFHPRKAYGEISSKDILIDVKKDVKVGLRTHLIDTSFSTILFFHGNGEIVTDYDDIASVYNQKNINFIIQIFVGMAFQMEIQAQKTHKEMHILY